MAAREAPQPVLPTPDSHRAYDQPLELQCGACGKKGKYSVGRIFIDTHLMKKEDSNWLNKAFSTTSFFHCKHCKAGGPWELTPLSMIALMVLVGEATQDLRRARIHLGVPVMFDGTISRCATDAEAHLKELIDKDPGNYFLWSRLGNLYKIGEAPDLALEALHEAVERNEHDIESLHSIGEIHDDRGEEEVAAGYYHQMLLHARHAPAKTSRELLRALIRQTLERLAMLHAKSGRRIPFLPENSLPGVKSQEEAMIFLSQYDLTDERDVERMVDLWMTGKTSAPRPPSQPAPISTPRSLAPRPAGPQRGGRNDPCPCRSGKKFKNCCLRS